MHGACSPPCIFTSLLLVVKRIDNAHEDCIWSVAWSKVNLELFSSLYSTAITGPCREWISGREGEDMVLAAVTQIQTIMKRRVADDKHKEHQLEGHTWGVVSVSVDASGKCMHSVRPPRLSLTAEDLASSSMDSHIRIWDLEKGSLVNTIEAFPVETWAVSWSRLVSARDAY